MKFGRSLILGISLLYVATSLTGCSSGGDYDPNYKTEVVLTPEQKRMEQENMAGQTPPGGVPGAPAGGAVDRNVMGKSGG